MDHQDLQAGQSPNFFWFKAKRELLRILAQKNLAELSELKILHIGAGTGDELAVFSKYGQNYVTDINPEALACVDPTLIFEQRQADATALPYPDNFFDLVVACDVFEHIENDHKAVSEVYRVLNPGGSLIFTVPAFQFLFSAHDKALSHFRRYNAKQVKTLLKNFDNLKIFYWNSVLFPLMVLKRLWTKNAPAKVDTPRLPGWLNQLFLFLLRIDNQLIKLHLSLPAGLSVVGVGRKKI